MHDRVARLPLCHARCVVVAATVGVAASATVDRIAAALIGAHYTLLASALAVDCAVADNGDGGCAEIEDAGGSLEEDIMLAESPNCRVVAAGRSDAAVCVDGLGDERLVPRRHD